MYFFPAAASRQHLRNQRLFSGIKMRYVLISNYWITIIIGDHRIGKAARTRFNHDELYVFY